MIKTKKGYHSITNGFVTFCFYEAAVTSFLSAYIDGDTDRMYELAILVVNNQTAKCKKSNWPHRVTNEFELANQIIRDRHRAERSQGID